MRAGLFLLALGLPLAAQDAPPPARVELEFKLAVPDGLEETVWSWWLQRYGTGPESILPELGVGFCASDSDEDFVDDYFDDTRFALHRIEAGLRHRKRWFREDVQHRKHGRELLQLKGPGALVRSEEKWNVRPLEWQGEPEENVPGLQLLSRGDRNELAASLKKLEVDPMDLVHVLQVQQRRRRIYVSRNDEAYATLTLDEAVVRKLWWRAAFSEIELELNEIRYTAAGPEERRAMEAMIERVKADILARFPEIRQDQTPKYNKAFAALEARAIAFRASVVIGLPLFLVLAFPIATGALIARAARRQAGLSSRRWR